MLLTFARQRELMMMAPTFSTLQSAVAGGHLFSNRGGHLIVAPPGARAPVPASPATVTPGLQFALAVQGLPGAWCAPGATGSVVLAEAPGGAWQVTATAAGIPALPDPHIKPVLWLIHDQTIPADLAPADLSALPKGLAATGNRLGERFTLDGNPPTYQPAPNLLSVVVSPGALSLAADGTWRLTANVDATVNRAFHPLVFLGPGALPDMNATLPSGTVAHIQANLFMRPATVHPELSLQTHLHQRLATIVGEALVAGADAFIEPRQFNRAAVTLEGAIRSTPRLLPTRETCILMATSPA